jgi:transcriptional regulator with XRE-family HTH domain
MRIQELARIIQRIMAQENITLTELAEKCGLSRTHLSTILNKNGVDNPKAGSKTVFRISASFPKYFDGVGDTEKNKGVISYAPKETSPPVLNDPEPDRYVSVDIAKIKREIEYNKMAAEKHNAVAEALKKLINELK